MINKQITNLYTKMSNHDSNRGQPQLPPASRRRQEERKGPMDDGYQERIRHSEAMHARAMDKLKHRPQRVKVGRGEGIKMMMSP